MKQAYQKLLDSNELSFDEAQVNAVDALNQLAEQLLNADKSTTASAKIKGLYFYGRVGRGKTMLMDLFYQNLNLNSKKRIHFHHFMEGVHLQLNRLKGTPDPLAVIAKQWAKEIKLLCFDEFFVSDIADAMLLAGLFSALFKEGVILVATSNSQPELLYRNGLQRERFIPTIALINQYCNVLSIDGDIDHRRKKHLPLDAYRHYFLIEQAGNDKLEQRFLQLTQLDSLSQADIINNQVESGQGISKDVSDEVIKKIIINNRDISYLYKTETVIWFDFFALCSGPRSQRDYIQLAKAYKAVLISNVPTFSGNLVPAVFSGVEDNYQRGGNLLSELRQLDDEARRFIALVDEFYDQNIVLIISAEVDIEALYQGQQLAFEFERCKSRLYQMQK
ncbi:AFG1 family ATPase [Colwellia sp. D2M02]|uniref:cell division protein ZapE n=1 Tax=Colwellia sp. D2M02 TaxID=2841562 RepID=UPI001C092112|nr:cell division protein ZapE [Colwellia sp. D2M02]MBU2893232.1 AFG1 family ATPase [Colwellia sp. D2M02]